MNDPIARIRAALKEPIAPSSDYDLNPEVLLPEGRKLREAAVLIPIDLTPDGARLWLTKRSSALKHHPGQVAFPGGKKDESDVDLTATALREAEEEIGLPPENVELLGIMPPHETVTGFSATPVVGRVKVPFVPKPEAGEVEEAFSVPLSHALDLENYAVQSRRWRGARRHYYAVPFGPYYIWGATARMLRAMADAASKI
ncbi:MAG: CoA pyrophosphatase [Pseudomonadota bacterium]